MKLLFQIGVCQFIPTCGVYDYHEKSMGLMHKRFPGLAKPFLVNTSLKPIPPCLIKLKNISFKIVYS